MNYSCLFVLLVNVATSFSLWAAEPVEDGEAEEVTYRHQVLTGMPEELDRAKQEEMMKEWGPSSAQQKAVEKTISENANVETKSPPKIASQHKAGYFQRLQNTYGCFVDFLKGVLKVRTERDFAVVECSQNLSMDCVNKNVNQSNQENISLSDQFTNCMNSEKPTGSSWKTSQH